MSTEPSVAPPIEALDTGVEVTRANITARREEQLTKLAALERHIAEKQATAAEITATIAELRELLPLLQQKRDVYRAAVHDAFSNHIAWLNAEQAYAEGAHDLTVQGCARGSWRPPCRRWCGGWRSSGPVTRMTC